MALQTIFQNKGLLLVLIVLVFAWATTNINAQSPPNISFISPTDPDGATVADRDWTQVNVSIESTYDTGSFINWDNSLVGYWDFDEGSGTTANDKSSYSNNGTINGATWTTGKFGSALSFDGTDNYVNVGNDPSFILGDFTLEAWVRTTSNSMRILSTYTGMGGNNFYQLDVDVSGYGRVWWRDTAANLIYLPGKTLVNDGQWHHVVGVRDAKNQILIYTDGELEDTGDDTTQDDTIAPETGYVYLGATVGLQSYFNGLIDEVKVYNRALSAEEIKASYNSKINNLSRQFTGLTDSTYQYYAYTTDTAGNSAQTETRTLTIDTGGSDVTPPVRSNGSPSGKLSAGTTQADISLTTSESATCKYSTTAGQSYDAMPNTFSTTGGTSHSHLITDLTDGSSYTFYVRCQDESGNKNTDDYLISFSILAVPFAPSSIYWTEEELDVLKGLTTAPTHATIWNNLKTWADAHVNDSPPSYAPGSPDFRGETIRQHVEVMGLMYAVTGDITYADSAVSWLNEMASWDPWASDLGSGWDGFILDNMLWAASAGYSLFRDYMTSAERQALADRIAQHANIVYDNATYSQPWQTSPGVNVWGRAAVSIGWAAIALDEDHPDTDTWLNQSVTMFQFFLDLGGLDGGFFEGANYTYIEFCTYIPFFEALKRVEGIDFFTDSSFLENFAYYVIYMHYNGTAFEMEDSVDWPDGRSVYYWDAWLNVLEFMPILAKEYDNGYAQYFFDVHGDPLKIRAFISRSPTVSPQDTNTLPLTRWFSDLGYVIMKTGWSDTDLNIIFKSGYSWGHAHEDQNSFTVYNNGEKVTGTHGRLQDSNLWEPDNIFISDATFDADHTLISGAQSYQWDSYGLRGQENGVGYIQAVELNEPYYRYVRGDASNAYQGTFYYSKLSGILSKYLRHFVFVENPNFFVVYDDVEAPEPSQIDMLMTGYPSLTLSNDKLVVPGQLTAQILEPAGLSYIITHYYRDAGYYIHDYDWAHIITPTQETSQKFLQVIFPDTELSSTMVEVGNLQGVMVTDGDDKHLVLFSSDGNPVDQYIELGDYYEAADGGAYTFNNTQVRAQFTTYQVMRLTQSGVPPETFTISSTNQLYLFRDQANTLSISGSNFDLSTDFSIQFIQDSNVISSFTCQSTNGTTFTLNLTSIQINTLPTGFYDLKVLRVSDNESQIHTKQILITQLGDLWSSTATEASEQKRDGQINLYDVSRLLSKWNSTNPTDLQEADINPGPANVSQDKIDLYDANLIMKNWSS